MDDYFDILDTLLLDHEECMLLSELDGFLTGIAVAPDLVLPSVWLRRIWGGGPAPFDDETTFQTFVELVTQHYNAVLESLSRPGGFEPVMDIDSRNGETLWELWAEGFAVAMKLSPKGWNRLRATEDEGARAALNGMIELVAIADGRIAPSKEDEQRWDRDAAVWIATWMPILHGWRQNADQNNPAGRAGRNDPCPCGSGKKYKKCCGLN